MIGQAPARIFISVLLPAPLLPTSPCTSPARSEKSTPSSAVSPPKRLETPRHSSNGVELSELSAVMLKSQANGAVTHCQRDVKPRSAVELTRQAVENQARGDGEVAPVDVTGCTCVRDSGRFVLCTCRASDSPEKMQLLPGRRRLIPPSSKASNGLRTPLAPRWSTFVYRNRMAENAWFWVFAETCRSVAKWVRNASIPGFANVAGCRHSSPARWITRNSTIQ